MPVYEAELSDGTQVEFESDHEPTREELEQAFAKQIKPEAPEEPEEKTGALEAFGRGVAAGVLPSAGAAGGGSLGRMAGTALATAIPSKGASLLPFAGMVGGAMIGGATTGALQNAALKATVPEFLRKEEQSASEHPIMSAAGRLAGMIPSFQLDPGLALKGVAAIPKVIQGTANALEKRAAMATATQLGTQLGLTGVQTGITQKRLPKPAEWGEAAAAAVLFGQPRFPRSVETALPRATQAARQAIKESEATHASSEPSPAGVSQAEVRTPVGEKAPLRQPGQAAPARTPEGESAAGLEEETPLLLDVPGMTAPAKPKATVLTANMHRALADLGWNRQDRAGMSVDDAEHLLANHIRKPAAKAASGQPPKGMTTGEQQAAEATEVADHPEVTEQNPAVATQLVHDETAIEPGAYDKDVQGAGNQPTPSQIVQENGQIFVQSAGKRLGPFKTAAQAESVKAHLDRNLGQGKKTYVLKPHEQAVIDQERQAIDAPVEIVGEPSSSEDPFATRAAGQFMGINRAKGTVEIYPQAFGEWLATVPAGRRNLAVRSRLAEEALHLRVNDADAQAYWDGATAFEKAALRRKYTGNWKGVNPANGQPISDVLLGHEALRYRLQQLARMTPSEVAESAFKERLTIRTLDALESVIRNLRKAFGTKASREQGAILNRLETNVAAGRAALTGQEPAAIRRGKPDSGTEDLFNVPKTGARLSQPERAPATEVLAKAEASRFEPVTPKSAEETAQAALGETRPSFEAFAGRARARFGPGVNTQSLRDIWQDSVWKRLMNASGAELTGMVRTMGLQKAVHLESPTGETRRIAEPIAEAGARPERTPEGFNLGLETPKARKLSAEERRSQNYRNNVIATVGNRLINEATEGRRGFQRSEVTPEDVGVAPEGNEPAWTDFRPEDASNPTVLSQDLVESSRAFGGAKLRKVINGKLAEIKQQGLPVSVTHRVTAIQNRQTGKVYLVSTFKDGRRGTVLLDPASPGKTHATLDSMLKRYRVLGSARLDEPVQNLHQSFGSLKDFEENFASPARSRSRLQTLQGHEPSTAGATGSWEVRRAPMTDAEAASILDHVISESGTFEGPDDVKASLVALKESTNYQVLSGYRKLFKQLERQNRDASTEELLDKLAKQIYENQSGAKTGDEFISRTVAQGSPPAGETPGRGPLTPVVQSGRIFSNPTEVTVAEGKEHPTGRALYHIPKPEAGSPKLGAEAEAQVAARAEQAFPGQPSRPYLFPTELTAKPSTKPPSRLPPGGAFRGAPTKKFSFEPAALMRTAHEEAAKNLKMVGTAIKRVHVDREIAALRDAADNISNNAGRLAERSIRDVTARKEPGIKGTLKDIAKPTSSGNAKVLSAANAVVQSGALEPDYKISPTAQTALNNFMAKDPQFRQAQNMMAHSDPLIQALGRVQMRAVRQRALGQVIQAGMISTKNLAYTIDHNAAGRLPQFLQKIAKGEAKARALMQTGNVIRRMQARRWLNAAQQLRAEVEYARDHWGEADLMETAMRMKQQLDNEYHYELQQGYNVKFDADYLPGRYDADFFDDNAVRFGAPRVLGKNFRQPKTFPTYYDAIEAGPYIAATRDGAAIVGHRVRQGQRRIQTQAWQESLKNLIDPETGKPVAKNATRRPDGTLTTDDIEYTLKNIIKGRDPIAVRKGYEDLIDQLTMESFVQKYAVTRAGLEWGQRLKHTILLGDVFHLGRLQYYGLSIMGRKAGWRGGLTALEHRTPQSLAEAVRNGTIRQAEADWAMARVPIVVKGKTYNLSRLQLVREFERVGLNIGKIQDAIYADLVSHVPLIGRYNRWLFDKFTRGMMAQAAVQSFERLNAKHPNADAHALIRDVATDINNYFGSIGRQGIWRSQSMQDLSRLAFLAPQWVEGLIMKEAGFAGRITGASNLLPRGRKNLPQLGVMGEGIGSGLVAMVALTQVINLIMRGKPTWQNEEKGHKFDAFIPSFEEGGKGFFFSPLAVFNELSHDVIRMLETKSKAWDVFVQIGENKLSPWGRLGVVLSQSRSPGSGARITTTPGIAEAALMQLNPAPISISALAQVPLSKTGLIPPPRPGAVQRQLLASGAGIKVEPARSAVQEIADKARTWTKANNLQKTTGWMEVPTDEASYSKLRAALRDRDTRGAQKILDALRQTHNDGDIVKAMRLWLRRPFTGSKRAEMAFLRSVEDADRELYSRAQEEKQQEYENFIAFLTR